MLTFITRLNAAYIHGLLSLVGLLLFVPFLGGVPLFDWDEINFAECAREMLVTGNYLQVQIGFAPFWEKPPLFIWLQALAMKLFGVNEWAARLPNALAGVFTLNVVFAVGKKLYSSRLGFLWSLAWLGSFLPHFYFRSGIIDPVFNLFIFLSVVYLFHCRNLGFRQFVPFSFLAGVFLGLAVLTKGPVAILLLAISFAGLLVWKKFQTGVPALSVVFTMAIALLTTGLWFGLETWKNGPWFLTEFVVYQYRLFSTPDAGHGGFPGYHFVVILIGCFPASFLALPALFSRKKTLLPEFSLWMVILLLVTLVLFSIVQSKIVHYSSLAYFPVTFFAALSMEKWIEDSRKIPVVIRFSILIIGLLIALLFLVTPIVGANPHLIISLLASDPFAVANLEANPGWPFYSFLPGLILPGLMAWFAFDKNRQSQRTAGLLSGMAVVIAIAIYVFPGRVEAYSQRAAIAFFQSLEGQNVYILPYRYKTYAHWFYARVHPENSLAGKDHHSVLTQPTSKPVYVIARIPKLPDLSAYPDLMEIGSQSGFVFYKKEQ